MPAIRFFLDTNVLLYQFDATAPRKARRADELVELALRAGIGFISHQVAQEFCNGILCSIPSPLSPAGAEKYLAEVLAPLIAVESSLDLLRSGLRLYERYRLAWYDALIVAAAQQARCSILYSEDFQHGQHFDSVRVINPFR